MQSLLRSLWVLCTLVLTVLAADVGFAFDGAIEGATATDESFNTGGSISINGFTVQIPKNLQVTFPAAFVPWKEFVAAYKSGSMNNYEVDVVGNFVGDKGTPIAGSVSISQFLTQASVGTIEKVNNDGTMQIKNGPVIRINDPNAKYSAGFAGAPFMTADDESPSISSFSGFPMCVPRKADDPLCPSSNRPTVGGSQQGTITPPNPLAMAPFVPGDFIEYHGFKNSEGVIVCYAIVATNIQLTAAAGDPPFIRIEDVNIGVFTNDPNAEVGETRFIGYISATSNSPLTISAIEIDPCTGKETDRSIGTVSIRPGEVRNKFKARITSQAGEKYTREYKIVAGSTKETSNNITMGQYISPPTEIIQPELTIPGLAPIPNEFGSFTHLTQGIGPDEQGNIWGPLDPFPQSNVKVFDISTCPPVTPGTGTGTGTTLSGTPSASAGTGTTPSSTASSGASATPSPVADTVRVVTAALSNSGGGTLSVTCTSTNKNSAQVAMTVDYTVSGQSRFNIPMTASTTTPGTWTWSGTKIKGTGITATCKSKAGGSATTTARRRRSMRVDARGADLGADVKADVAQAA